MLKILVTLAVLSGAISQTPGTPAAPDLSSLAWMGGSWGATINGVEMEEHWTTARGTMMVGMHRDIGKTRTSFEFLRIVVQEGKLVYLASPGGRPPTPFTLKEVSGTRAVFENLEHDFPQRIIYWKDGADLRARIEGPQNGKTVGQEWRWPPLKN